MRLKSLWTFSLVLLLPAVAAAQDDYDFANGLAKRGWYDVAEEKFLEIQNNSSLAGDKRAEGKFGLARMKMMMAERETDNEAKQKAYDAALDQINEFIKAYPQHPRLGEAFGDIGSLYQSRGKFLMGRAKSDPTMADKAEASFKKAEDLFQQQIKSLEKKKLFPPSAELQKSNPSKFEKDYQDWEEWNRKMMYAKYNYGISLFSHAETYKDIPGKHADMKKLLNDMNKFFVNDFMWEYEWYLLAYDAFIYMGRAYQIQAEASKGKEAEKHWRDCFSYIGKAKGLLDDKNSRRNPGVQEIASRGIYFEIKARLIYGASLRGGAATRQYREAAKIATALFKSVPNLKKSNMGKAILTEQARAWCKAGDLDRGREILDALVNANKGTWVEDLCIDIMGEYLGEKNPDIAVRAAENLRVRGAAYLFRAIQKYRRALDSLKGHRQANTLAPKCWYGIGWCYYYQNRYFEAAAALKVFESKYQRSEDAIPAAFLKLSALKKIKAISGDPRDEQAYKTYRNWVTGQPHLAKRLGDSTVRDTAVELEHDAREAWNQKDYKNAATRYKSAVAKWQQIAKPNGGFYEEAIFSVGFNSFRQGESLARVAEKMATEFEKRKTREQAKSAYNTGIAAFKKHLAFVELPNTERTTNVLKRAIGAILFSVRAYTGTVMNDPDKALEISDGVDTRFPKADPLLVIAIMRARIEARVTAGKVADAEVDLLALKAKFQKAQLGQDHYMRALGLVAEGFRTAAALARKNDNLDTARTYDVKAAKYMKQYFDYNPSEDPEQKEAMAGILYDNAEIQWEEGVAKSDKGKIKEARELYKEAGELLENIFERRSFKMDEPTKKAFQLRIARCQMRQGNVDAAIARFQELTRNDQDRRDGSTWEALADAYMDKSVDMGTGGEQTKLITDAAGIYGSLASALLQGNRRDEHYYRLLYKYVKALSLTDLHKLETFFRSMDARGNGWDKKNNRGVWDWDEKKQKYLYGYGPKIEAVRDAVKHHFVEKKDK